MAEERLDKTFDVLVEFPNSTTTIGIDLAKCSTLLLDNVSLGGDVIILRKKHNNVNPEFISYYLNIICKHAIAEKTKGVTIYHLHGKDLIAIQISYPSLSDVGRAEYMVRCCTKIIK